jgi:nucleotide-binding universal stress UspA family protein
VEAFRVASSVAGPEARLIVLHAIDPDSDAAGTTVGSEALRETLLRHLREVYIPDRPLEVEYHLGVGAAPIVILRAADGEGADLIAMGTHGRTGLRRLFAGSVAMDVLHAARCPVLALHDGRGEAVADIRVILLPTDFTKASEAALVPARALARDLGARLVVLHVIPLAPDIDGGIAAVFDHGEYEHTLDEIRHDLDGPDLKYPVETWLCRGRVVDEILRVARELECNLIVTGTHGRTGLGRLFLGNVAESLVPRAECPVLVVKSPTQAPASADAVVATAGVTSSPEDG